MSALLLSCPTSLLSFSSLFLLPGLALLSASSSQPASCSKDPNPHFMLPLKLSLTSTLPSPSKTSLQIRLDCFQPSKMPSYFLGFPLSLY